MAELYKVLQEEAKKHGWGLILIQKRAFDNFVNALLQRFSAVRLLDVGCWTALLLDYVKQKWGDRIHYTGVDVVKPNGARSCEYYIMSGDSLLFPANRFEAVCFIESLEHIPDYVRALREAYRVLVRGGGVFIQSVVCTDKCATADRTHYHVLHPVTLKRLLEWIGFTNVQYVEGGNFAAWGFKP